MSQITITHEDIIAVQQEEIARLIGDNINLKAALRVLSTKQQPEAPVDPKAE